jgi:DNA invertase Pin-like site-specific DNA recombinase
MRVAVYLRISHDPTNSQIGVERQRVDCRAIASIRLPNATVVEYIDNDVSAYHRRPRPAYERMLGERPDLIVAWNLDRLLRQPRDLEHLIDLGIPIVTAQGDLDLTTHDGQLHARILAAVAKKASDDTSRRVARAAKDRAEAGRFHGGRYVPYGYVNTGPGELAVDPDAAEVIRDVARRVLDGEPLNRAIASLPAGAPRKREAWRQLLTGNTIRGRNKAGYPATWPAIIDPTTAALLHNALQKRSRSRPLKKWPLSAVARCGVCGGKLYGTVTHGQAHYFCRACHGVSIAAGRLERVIEGALDEAVIAAPVEAVPTQPNMSALAHLAAEYAAGRISKLEWEAARQAISSEAKPVVPPASQPLEGWQRLVAIDRIVVNRATKRGGPFEPERVDIVWRA